MAILPPTMTSIGNCRSSLPCRPRCYTASSSSLLLLLLVSSATLYRSPCIGLSSSSSSSSSINGNYHRAVNAPASPRRRRRPLRVVVIGAGIGGLATAARIKSSFASSPPPALPNADEDGCAVEVVILEKNSRDRHGGRCGSFDVHVRGYGNFRHERGPSLLLLPDEYYGLFGDCGIRGSSRRNRGDDERDDDDDASSSPSSSSSSSSPVEVARAYGLEVTSCVPAYQVIFDDGDVLSLGFPKESPPSTLSIDDARLPHRDRRRRVENIERMKASEMESIRKLNSMEVNGHDKWMEYLNTCSAYLDCGLPNFIEGRMDIKSVPNFAYESLRDGGKNWPLRPHSRMLNSIFDGPKLRALASFQNLYVGLEPYENEDQWLGGITRKTAPAVFGLLSALEMHPTYRKSGVYAPIGGFRNVANSLSELCKDLNVEIRYDTRVTSVTDAGVYYLRDNDNDDDNDGNVAVGWDLSSSEEARGKRTTSVGYVDADLVICNADLPYATETILNKIDDDNNEARDDEESRHQETYDWNDKLDYSTGVIAFHWSVSRPLSSLNTHNVFMSANTTSDAVESWAVIRDDDHDMSTKLSHRVFLPMKGRPFNFYVHRPSMTDITACPPGCDSIMVLVPCPPLRREGRLASLPRSEAIDEYKCQFDADFIDDVRDAVFQRLAVLKGLENIRDSILNEVVDTPGTYADYYNVGAGVPFGLQSHGLGQLSLTRPGSECKTHENVLFVGASSRPGNGVPLVLIGSRQVAKKAVDKLKNMMAQ
ncbi:hypothetical protein ACHAXA_010377 [Cyclostephanos tholiformis]|uniref:Amine oxidase domain-containing protein n=1 Tax=Cyclostephanos tholiformis TaxID=382380 RepID=A0ABD3RBQ2_9STRA